MSRTPIFAFQWSFVIDICGFVDTLGVSFVVGVAQLVRAPGCGLGGRGFKSRHSPHGPATPGQRVNTINGGNPDS